MYGAIIGDVVGSTYEFAGRKTKSFPLFPGGSDFTDDTIMTIAVAKTRHTKEEIRDYIREHFYPLDKTLDEIRPDYEFHGSCQDSVPQSIQAFLESKNYEDALRNVISLGGDADTMGAITGAIAWSFYRFQTDKGISIKMANMWIKTAEHLPEEWLDLVLEFDKRCRQREDAYVREGNVKRIRLE